MLSRLIILLLALLLCGCDTGLRHMGEAEYGLRFRKLPQFLGGGLSSQVARPGETIIVMPWESIYRFDTREREVAWGAKGSGTDPSVDDYVQTRALDGNEVALAVAVRYRVTHDPQMLLRVAEEVATSDAEIQELVSAVARADIRTAMNRLRTSAFFINESKYKGQEEVKELMHKTLGPYGIEILSVNLGEHRFERHLPDGSVDHSYQEKINEVQTTEEQTKREKLRVTTVKADKEREFNSIQAEVNRVVEEAKGYLEQTRLRSDAYFDSRRNESEAVRKAGKAEVEGLAQQIAAFAGPGGEALLKLEIAKQLLRSDPRFVLMNEGGNQNGMGVRRIDTNQLLDQLGLFEGLQRDRSPAVSSSVVVGKQLPPKAEIKEEAKQ